MTPKALTKLEVTHYSIAQICWLTSRGFYLKCDGHRLWAVRPC